MHLILNSCRQEAVSDENSSGIRNNEIPYFSVKLNTGNSSAEEDQISKIRTVVVNAADQIVTNAVSMPDAPVNDDFRLTAKANFGECIVYIICNETKELEKKLERISYGSEIESIQYSANNLTTPLTMYAKVSNIRIDYDKETQTSQVYQDNKPTDLINVTVVRTMAKLSFIAIKKVNGGEKFSVESLSFQVCQTPRYSQLPTGRVYDPTEGWADRVTVKGEGSLSSDKEGSYIEKGDGYEVNPGDESIITPSVYIPEHLLNKEEDEVNCTYLLVEAKCKREGSSTIINAKFRINIGKNPPISHQLSRNTHYRIYTTIESMGATGIYAEIVPLKEYNTPIVWKSPEGYTIIGECETEQNNDIWNNFSQYSGILKIKKSDGQYSDALFRYGSIVALEPTNNSSSFTSNNVIWKQFVSSSITNWNDLAYLSKDENVSEAHTLENIKKGKGDPCKLIGLTPNDFNNGIIDNETWRMPTNNEMKWLLNAKGNSSDGKGFYSYHYLLTPNTGFRTENGIMEPATTKGYYWSATQANALLFNSADNTGSVVASDPQKAFAIRCIRSSIPPSRLAVNEATIDYNGKADIPLELTDLFLTPYWKMEAEPPSEKITFTKKEGTYQEQALVTIAKSDFPYEPHFYKIKVTGYGLNGATNVAYTQIRQVALSHAVSIKLVSPSDLPISGGYIRLPQKETTLGFQIDVSPALKPPYNQLNIGSWRVHVSYYDSKSHNFVGSLASIGEVSFITIPENVHGGAIALYFEMKPQDISKFPPYTTRNLIVIHETK